MVVGWWGFVLGVFCRGVEGGGLLLLLLLLLLCVCVCVCVGGVVVVVLCLLVSLFFENGHSISVSSFNIPTRKKDTADLVHLVIDQQ